MCVLMVVDHECIFSRIEGFSEEVFSLQWVWCSGQLSVLLHDYHLNCCFLKPDHS